MTATKTRAVCEEHKTTNPCNGCRADHLAGDHTPGTRTKTCRMCRAHKRGPRPSAVPVRVRRAAELVDVAALAAHDTDLIKEHTAP